MKALLLVLEMMFGRAPEHDASIALAQAWFESRYDDTAVSRRVGNTRQTGAWGEAFPKNWRGPYFCGVWQVGAKTERDCVAMRSTLVAWFKRRDEMRAWLSFCNGRVKCALNGYGCGIKGARSNQCNGYAERVLSRAHALNRHLRDSAVW